MHDQVEGADDPFYAAGADWRRRIDAKLIQGLAPGSPNWPLFATTLADEEVLPATMAALGLHHRVKTFYPAPLWWPDACGPVMVMGEDGASPACLAVEAWLGRWQPLPLAGVIGANLLDLAGLRLGMSPGKAAFHLAYLLGRDIPRVPA